MQIRRYLSLDKTQLLGCTSAFLDALDGEMQSGLSYLRRLEGSRKGGAFGFEMQLDKHRYGVLIVLDRWVEFANAFAATADARELQAVLSEAPARARSAAGLTEKMNAMIDAADAYGADLVEACAMTFHTVEMTFGEEREAVKQVQSLGPMIPEDYRTYRSVFAGDLAVR